MTRKHLISIYLPLLTFIALVIGIWLPFGFKTIGTFEEWLIIGEHMLGHNIFIITPNSDLSSFASRPFAFFVFGLAHVVSPDSFLGFNLLQMLFFIGKGYFTYLIIRVLAPKHLIFAFLVAVLFVFHPADTLVYTFRTINIHAAVMLYLIAVYCLLKLQEKLRWWLLLLMWIALATSLLMYEVPYPIVAFTPLLLVWVARRITKRVIDLSLLWYVVPLLTGSYYIYIYLTVGSDQLYQTAGREISTLPQVLEALEKLYTRSFIHSWQEIQLESSYVLIALVLSGLVFATTLFLWRAASREALSIKRLVTLLLIGIVVIILGFSFYLVFSSYRLQTTRTYYISALGAALSTGVIIYLLVRRKQLVFSGVMTVLIGIALINAFNQHAQYHAITMRQQRFLGKMFEQLPSVKEEQTIYIRDYTTLLESEEMFFKENMTMSSALKYLYKNPTVDAIICYMEGSYKYDIDGVSRVPCNLPTSDMIVFDYSFEDELKLVTKTDKKETYDPPAMFACWPIEICTTFIADRILSAPTVLDFDQTDLLGTGWSQPIEHLGTTLRWSIEEVSKVVFAIGDETTYKISFQLYDRGIDPDGPALFVNDTPVHVSNPEGNYFEAVIPRKVVQENLDVLRFVSDELRPPGMGFAIDWLKIEPFIPNDNALISFDGTLSGTGWRGAETMQDGTTFQWSVEEIASVNLGFLAQDDYRVNVTPINVLEPNTFEDVELWVDGRQLNSVYDPGLNLITAVLPQASVQEAEVTVLQIRVPQRDIDQRGTLWLGVAIDQIQVEPLVRTDHVQIEFDESVSGSGWRGAETTGEGVTFQWSIEETASIELGLLAPQDYRIEVHPVMILEPNTLEDVEFWVGQTQLNSEVDETTGRIIAMLPRSLVDDYNSTELQIKVPQLVPDMAETFDLGIAIDLISVTSDGEGIPNTHSN